jgi:hypothetical protein
MTTIAPSQPGKLLKRLVLAACALHVVGIGICLLWVNTRSTSHSPRLHCVMNLRAIEGAKASWALENKKLPTDTPKDDDLFGLSIYIREKPQAKSARSRNARWPATRTEILGG